MYWPVLRCHHKSGSMLLLCLTESEKRERRKAQTKMARKLKKRGQDLFVVVFNSVVLISVTSGFSPELHSVQLFFLKEFDGTYAILFQPSIHLAAINAQGGGSTYLVSTKVLQD